MGKDRILMHICCAPCAIYPLTALRSKGFEVEGIFFNPNIHPQEEFITRQQSVAKLASIKDLPVYYPQHRPEKFFQETRLDKYTDKRCNVCWSLRLAEVADFALRNGFKSFTSTLLVSPYQNNDLIKESGFNLAREKKIDFYYEDFRPGFYSVREEVKKLGLYSQKYCGCIYSKEERSNNNQA